VRRPTSRRVQFFALGGIWTGGLVTLAIIGFIVIYVLARGLPGLSLDFFTTDPQGGLSGEGGIRSVLVSTLYLLGLTLAILVPIGLGSAIYLAEYAPYNAVTRLIRFGVDTLGGIPSIVFGIFGFIVFVTFLHFDFSILSGALALTCLLLPTLIATAEEAIRAVPRGYREAGLALGATRWQVISRVVLPAAMPGIITGVILCVGRAIGETAVLYVTMGGSAGMPTSLLSGGRTLALHVFYLATETRAFEKSLTTAAVLIIVIMGINALTNWLSQRFQAGMRGRT
jgi:phosphate transport system permease protein